MKLEYQLLNNFAALFNVLSLAVIGYQNRATVEVEFSYLITR